MAQNSPSKGTGPEKTAHSPPIFPSVFPFQVQYVRLFLEFAITLRVGLVWTGKQHFVLSTLGVTLGKKWVDKGSKSQNGLTRAHSEAKWRKTGPK